MDIDDPPRHRPHQIGRYQLEVTSEYQQFHLGEVEHRQPLLGIPMIPQLVRRDTPRRRKRKGRGASVAEHQDDLGHGVGGEGFHQGEKIAATTRDGDGDTVGHSPEI